MTAAASSLFNPCPLGRASGLRDVDLSASATVQENPDSQRHFFQGARLAPFCME